MFAIYKIISNQLIPSNTVVVWGKYERVVRPVHLEFNLTHQINITCNGCGNFSYFHSWSMLHHKRDTIHWVDRTWHCKHAYGHCFTEAGFDTNHGNCVINGSVKLLKNSPCCWLRYYLALCRKFLQSLQVGYFTHKVSVTYDDFMWCPSL